MAKKTPPTLLFVHFQQSWFYKEIKVYIRIHIHIPIHIISLDEQLLCLHKEAMLHCSSKNSWWQGHDIYDTHVLRSKGFTSETSLSHGLVPWPECPRAVGGHLLAFFPH